MSDHLPRHNNNIIFDPVAIPSSSPVHNPTRMSLLDGQSQGSLFVPDISNITAYWPMGDAQGSIIIDRVGNSHGVIPLPPPQPSSKDFVIGSNDVGGQALQGRLAQVGQWHRLLTNGEKTAVSGGEKWPFSTTTSLQDASVYYLLDEVSSSSTFADATGRGNTLTKVGAGSTTQVTGPGGTGFAAQFPGTCRLSRAANADLKPGLGDFTCCCWVQLDTKAGADQQIFFGQASIEELNIGVGMYYHAINDKFQTDYAAGDVGNLSQIAVVVDGTPSVSVWYFVLFQYNSATKTISLQVNNGAAVSLSTDIQPSPVTGHINTATQFKSTPQYINTSGYDTEGGSRAIIPNSSAVTFGDRNRMVWMWLYLDSSATQTIMGYYDSTIGPKLDWLLQYYSGELYFLIGNNGASAPYYDFVKVAITLNTWHLVVAWFDQGTGKLHLNLDNSSAVAVTPGTITITPAQTSAPILIGADPRTLNGDYYGNQFIGKLEGVGMASQTASPSNITYLWNGGAGVG